MMPNRIRTKRLGGAISLRSPTQDAVLYNVCICSQPLSVYAKKRKGEHYPRFRGADENPPLLLSFLLGLQHACVAYGNVVVPALMLSWAFPADFEKCRPAAVSIDDVLCVDALQSAFIISGLGSLLQCMQIKIPGMPCQIGTGMCSFVGNSLVFGTMTVALTG